MWCLFRHVIYSNNFWAVNFFTFGSADRRLVSIIKASNPLPCRISAVHKQSQHRVTYGSLLFEFALFMFVSVLTTLNRKWLIACKMKCALKLSLLAGDDFASCW